MGVRKNPLQVFISKYGIDGAIQLGVSAGSGRPGRTRTQPAEQQISADIEVTYDEAHCSLLVCNRAACASDCHSETSSWKMRWVRRVFVRLVHPANSQQRRTSSICSTSCSCRSLSRRSLCSTSDCRSDSSLPTFSASPSHLRRSLSLLLLPKHPDLDSYALVYYFIEPIRLSPRPHQIPVLSRRPRERSVFLKSPWILLIREWTVHAPSCFFSLSYHFFIFKYCPRKNN